MVRWCWANFQCRGVLLIWIRVGQGPSVLAVGAGGGCLDIFSLVCHFSFFLPLWETAQYRLKYCLKGPLGPKQPTNYMLRKHVFAFFACAQLCTNTFACKLLCRHSTLIEEVNSCINLNFCITFIMLYLPKIRGILKL